MKDADAWFAEAMHHVGMSFSADYRSELIGDLEDALAAFEQALALRPDHPQALKEKAIALARLDRHEDAAAAFARAIRVRPEEAELHLLSAESLAKLERHAEALAACEETLARRPQDAKALYLRAQTLDALGLSEEALATWERFLRQPAGPPAGSHVGYSWGVSGPFFRARARIARAVDLAKTGRHAEAVAAFRELWERDDVRSAEDALHAALANIEAARTAFAGFLAARPEEPGAWLRAGRAYARAGLAAEALRACQTATRLAPGSADAWWELAEALVRAGRREDSIAMFDETLRIKPDYLGAKARRDIVLRAISLARDADDSKRPGAHR